MNRASRPVAPRLAAVGAALSLAAVSAVPMAASAAERPATPAAPATPPSKASPPPPTDEAGVDDELLEFLGSIGDGGNDGDWLEFLTNTDIDEVAKRGSKTPSGGR